MASSLPRRREEGGREGGGIEVPTVDISVVVHMLRGSILDTSYTM